MNQYESLLTLEMPTELGKQDANCVGTINALQVKQHTTRN